MIKQVKFPQLWNEKGENEKWEEMQSGYLIKMSLENSNTPSTYLGIFRGFRDYECGKLLKLEIPFNGFEKDAPSLCCTGIKEFDLNRVQLVEILIRETHAVFIAFHHYGTLRVEYELFRDRMRKACELIELARYCNR